MNTCTTAPAPLTLPPVMLRSLLFLALSVAACDRANASATPPSETPAAPQTDGAAPVADDGSRPFHELDKDGKMQRMTKIVTPQMGEIFKAWKPDKYAKFGCDTCHVNHVHHPKDGLPKLVLSGGGYEKLVAEQPEMMKFMGEQVAPAMAKAMGEPPFDPATGQGFGCGGCHSVE